jgi:hypothetical protein
MTYPTERGDKLAAKLNPMMGTTLEIRETCALIARHARTHNRYAEMWCSVELSDRETARLERRETALEARITDLVSRLPETDDGPITVRFDGDPRGHTVKLVLPGESRRHADVWDQESIGADV